MSESDVLMQPRCTEERYEQILKAYNLPARGDTNAKRELLREFIGLTPPC